MRTPANTPTYDQVALWYLDRTIEIQERIRALDWSSLLDPSTVRVSSRVKTITTLVDKLRRNPKVALQTIRDIAGVRLEADMSLTKQTAVCETLSGVFSEDCAVVITDMRTDDHFGYRAMHLELRHPGQGWRAEIQVRTDLQGKWANLYEVAGDVLGRGIRYSATSPDQPEHAIVQTLQRLSTESVASVEAEDDQATSQEVRVEDIRRGLIPGNLGAEERKLESLRATAEPVRLALSDQLESLTAELQRIRNSKG